MLTIKTHIPSKLARIVKSFWYLEVNVLNGPSYAESILPDGHHEIIFHSSMGNGKRRFDKELWVDEPAAFIAGQTVRNYSLNLKSGSYLYGIRFHPHTFSVLFDIPANETTDTIISLDDLPGARDLKHCLDSNPEVTFSNFEKTLARIYGFVDTNTGEFEFMEYAIQEIARHHGNLKIDSLLTKVAVSHRHFDTLFHKSVGLTPKAFCNIVRLNYFINLRSKNPHKTLTECAYEAGFYDQSHLIKFFQAVTDQTPKSYFKDANQINSIFSEL